MRIVIKYNFNLLTVFSFLKSHYKLANIVADEAAKN